MKHSYPDSLLSLSALFAAAASAAKNEYDNDVAGNNGKRSTFLKFNWKRRSLGIKFDNISAGKYFALINRTQRHSVVGMKMRKID